MWVRRRAGLTCAVMARSVSLLLVASLVVMTGCVMTQKDGEKLRSFVKKNSDLVLENARNIFSINQLLTQGYRSQVESGQAEIQPYYYQSMAYEQVTRRAQDQAKKQSEKELEFSGLDLSGLASGAGKVLGALSSTTAVATGGGGLLALVTTGIALYRKSKESGLIKSEMNSHKESAIKAKEESDIRRANEERLEKEHQDLLSRSAHRRRTEKRIREKLAGLPPDQAKAILEDINTLDDEDPRV